MFFVGGKNPRLIDSVKPGEEEINGFSTVGMPVTRHPPCRPRRAVFPHRVPRSYSLPRCKAAPSSKHPPSLYFRDPGPGYNDMI